MSRYDGRILIVNDDPLYVEQFVNRKVLRVNQFSTPIIRYPTVEEMGDFVIFSHVWKLGDRFYKLSDEHYGSVNFWWVIPWFNKKALESDFKLGDTIHIPRPLELALTYFNIG
jgi:hypothetical protein